MRTADSNLALLIEILKHDSLFSKCFGPVLEKVDAQAVQMILTSHTSARQALLTAAATSVLATRIHLIEPRHLSELIALLNNTQARLQSVDRDVASACSHLVSAIFARVRTHIINNHTKFLTYSLTRSCMKAY